MGITYSKSRKDRVEGRELVTRERTTESMAKKLPLPSSYVKFEESIPMVPDPVLRAYLKGDLTYQDFRDMAFAWYTYTEKKHPSSRELSSVMTGHSTHINAKSSQLSFFFLQCWLSA